MQVEIDPAEVGLDGRRLERIGEYLGRYTDEGTLVGWQVAVTRHGKVAYVAQAGDQDREAGRPVGADAIWRIFSMSKPITSAAVMALVEQGVIDLRDPVSAYIPSFADGRVFVGGSTAHPITEASDEEVRIWHLLTHTSGLTYGRTGIPFDDFYIDAGVARRDGGLDLAERAERWGSLPRLFHPGTAWCYSASIDVLGRVLEVATGRPLDQHLAETIFEPLQMVDTGFTVAPEKVDRLASLYTEDPDTRRPVAGEDARAVRTHGFLSGGGGLYSTADDYHRFTQMLLGGGELDGVRILGPRTVRAMGLNQLPDGQDIEQLGKVGFEDHHLAGTGFGYGFSVVVDPTAARTLASRGEMAWSGAASTFFWIDPRERISVMFFTQLLPVAPYPAGVRMRNLVAQAITERAFGRGPGRRD